jgi:hypothetical protein
MKKVPQTFICNYHRFGKGGNIECGIIKTRKLGNRSSFVTKIGYNDQGYNDHDHNEFTFITEKKLYIFCSQINPNYKIFYSYSESQI